MAAGPENTGEQRADHATRFKPGNPGRPKGARHKLSENFVKALAADFEQHGSAAIVSVREEKPDQYLKVIASIIPKEIDFGDNLAAALKESRDAAAGAFYRAMAEDLESLH